MFSRWAAQLPARVSLHLCRSDARHAVWVFLLVARRPGRLDEDALERMDGHLEVWPLRDTHWSTMYRFARKCGGARQSALLSCPTLSSKSSSSKLSSFVIDASRRSSGIASRSRLSSPAVPGDSCGRCESSAVDGLSDPPPPRSPPPPRPDGTGGETLRRLEGIYSSRAFSFRLHAGFLG